MPTVVFDARWIGPHGIGRFAREVHDRLDLPLVDIEGLDPVSPKGLAELGPKVKSALTGLDEGVFLSPGYCPPVPFVDPMVLVIHDLIHVDVAAERSLGKTAYYNLVVRPAMRRCRIVLTVSEFSRSRLLDWSGLPADRVRVVGNGVDPNYRPDGPSHNPGYRYVLSVGNKKPHKNLDRLVDALIALPADVHLLMTGNPDASLVTRAAAAGTAHRLHFAGLVPEEELPILYRGAAAVAIPSLYEGFGLPALEGLACGVPVVAADAASLPEVVGEAGVLVDPLDTAALAEALRFVVDDAGARERAQRMGPAQAAKFNWDEVAARVRASLLEVC